MKLELKHLAPYLPYGLKVIVCHNEYTMSLNDDMDDFYVMENVIEYQNKPLLRPLSDLSKEINHHGEIFVPLIELCKIAFPKIDRGEIIDDYVKMVHNYSLHFIKHSLSFDCRHDFDGKRWNYSCFVDNQFELYQKLFEWHFDVFGLIENGLAIRIL